MALGKYPSLVLFRFWWFLAILFVLWLTVTFLQSLSPLLHSLLLPYVYLLHLNIPLLSLMKIPVMNLRPALIQDDLTLAWSHLWSLYFQMRSHSQVPGLGCEHIFLEHIIQATTNNVPDIFLWPSVYTPPFSAILSAPGSWPTGYHDLWLPAGFCKWEAPGGIGGTEKSEAREFIYLVPFCEEPSFAVCLDRRSPALLDSVLFLVSVNSSSSFWDQGWG